MITLKTNLPVYGSQRTSHEQNTPVELVSVVLLIALLLDVVVVRGERRKGHRREGYCTTSDKQRTAVSVSSK